MSDINAVFAGRIHSPNPFWLASGPPTNCGEQVMRAFDAGWGGAVWKTLGEPIVNVTSRYSSVDLNGVRMMGLNNIELITDRPLDVNLREIAEVHRVLELARRGRYLFGGVLLREHGVAGIAVFWNDLAFGANVLSIVTAEASTGIKMPDIVRVRLPVQLHLRKSRALENSLHFVHCIPDIQLTTLRQVGIAFLVVTLHRGRNSLHSLRRGRIRRGQSRNRLLLDERQRRINPVAQQRLVHSLVRRHVYVRWAIVAIDTIHVVLWSLGDLLFGQFRIGCVILSHPALQVLGMNI